MVKDNSIKSNSSYDAIITKSVKNTLNKNLEISSKDNIKTNKRSKILLSKGVNEKILKYVTIIGMMNQTKMDIRR